MLAEAGAKIYIVKNDGSLELSIQAFSYEVEREVRCDLKTEKGQVDIKLLLQTMDVLVESFRPGVMERLGLGP